MLIATKLKNVVTYHKGLPLITSHDSSMTWLYEVTLLVKYVISSLAQYDGFQTHQGGNIP